MNETQVTCGGFIVARCQSTGALEFVEAAFSMVPQSVGYGIDLDGYPSIGFAGNDRHAATLYDCVSDMVAIVAPVCEKHFGLRQIIID